MPLAEAKLEQSERVGLGALYRVFFLIGLFSFGGGLVSWIHREVVVVRGWLTDEEFLPGVALAQILPGVNSTNLAIHVGRNLRGAGGAAVALAAVLTGPFVAVLLVAMAYRQLLGVAWLHAAMAGVAAAAIGMLLRVTMVSVQTAYRGWLSLLVAALTFGAVGILHWPLFLVVFGLGPLSVWLAWPKEADHG